MQRAQKPEPQPHDLDRIFAALAHSSRREILLVLHLRGGTMTAGEIAERFACAWPTTTRHLRALTDAGLLSVRRHGRERLYTLDLNQLVPDVAGWLAWFSQAGHPVRHVRTRTVPRVGSGGDPMPR